MEATIQRLLIPKNAEIRDLEGAAGSFEHRSKKTAKGPSGLIARPVENECLAKSESLEMVGDNRLHLVKVARVSIDNGQRQSIGTG